MNILVYLYRTPGKALAEARKNWDNTLANDLAVLNKILNNQTEIASALAEDFNSVIRECAAGKYERGWKALYAISLDMKMLKVGLPNGQTQLNSWDIFKYKKDAKNPFGATRIKKSQGLCPKIQDAYIPIIKEKESKSSCGYVVSPRCSLANTLNDKKKRQTFVQNESKDSSSGISINIGNECHMKGFDSKIEALLTSDYNADEIRRAASYFQKEITDRYGANFASGLDEENLRGISADANRAKREADRAEQKADIEATNKRIAEITERHKASNTQLDHLNRESQSLLGQRKGGEKRKSRKRTRRRRRRKKYSKKSNRKLKKKSRKRKRKKRTRRRRRKR